MEAAGSPAPSTSLISWSERLAATPVAVANTAQGRRLVFSIISNNYLSTAAPIRALENRVALALVQWHD